MDYIRNFFSGIVEIFSLDVIVNAYNYFLSLGIVPVVSILLMLSLFLIEIFLFIAKRPKRFSNLILIIGILGAFVGIYNILIGFNIGAGNNFDLTVLAAKQFLSCALIGIIAGILSVILCVLESFYYSSVNDAKSINRSVKDLALLLKEDRSNVKKNFDVQSYERGKTSTLDKSTSSKIEIEPSDLQHISQQIYDLTHHLKQELGETREKLDQNTEKLIIDFSSLIKEINKNVSTSSVLGPKIVAKSSINPQGPPSSNDSSSSAQSSK